MSVQAVEIARRAQGGDGGEYRYVMLWCRPFRVPIGVGELR